MAKQQFDTKTLLTVGAVGLGVYLLYKPIKKLFDTFGITESSTEQEVTQQQSAGVKSPFSPLYWRQFKKSHILTQVQAKAKAKAIRDSFGAFGDNYVRILAVFKTLNYKTQVSYLAETFAKLYKADLLQALQSGRYNTFWSGLSDKQLQTIIDLVNKLK